MPATTDLAPLTPGELAAWRSFIEAVGDLENALERDLAPHGLSLGEYQVLVHLSEAAHRSLRMVDLAAALHLTPSGLTRRLDRLAHAGYVDRVPSGDDRRVMLAVLTDAGLAKLEKAYPAHLASVRRWVFDRISPGDVEPFGRVFEAIGTGLCDAAVTR